MQAVEKIILTINSCKDKEQLENTRKWVNNQLAILDIDKIDRDNIYKVLFNKDTEIKLSIVKNLQVTADMSNQIASIITNNYKKINNETLYDMCNKFKTFTLYQSFKIFYEVASVFWGRDEADKLLNMYSDRF